MNDDRPSGLYLLVGIIVLVLVVAIGLWVSEVSISFG